MEGQALEPGEIVSSPPKYTKEPMSQLPVKPPASSLDYGRPPGHSFPDLPSASEALQPLQVLAVDRPRLASLKSRLLENIKHTLSQNDVGQTCKTSSTQEPARFDVSAQEPGDLSSMPEDQDSKPHHAIATSNGTSLADTTAANHREIAVVCPKHATVPQAPAALRRLGSVWPTERLSYECQKRQFNPQFSLLEQTQKGSRWKVVLRDVTLTNQMAYRDSMQAKRALATEALEYLAKTPSKKMGGQAPSPEGEEQGPKSHTDGTSNDIARERLRADEDRQRQKRLIMLRDQSTSRMKKESSNVDGVNMDNPVEARAFLQGFQMGQQVGAAKHLLEVPSSRPMNQQSEAREPSPSIEELIRGNGLALPKQTRSKRWSWARHDDEQRRRSRSSRSRSPERRRH